MSERKMRILFIAYPLLPVSDASAGGAEQMLWMLEREMHRRGHETTVAACAGSSVSGRLFATGDPPRESDTFDERDREHRHYIHRLLEREPFDFVHDKSGSFFLHTADLPVPVVASLHLPRSFYKDVNWLGLARKLSLNCVSAAQAHTFVDVPNLAGWVQNGIDVERFPLRADKHDYLLWLGRICEEKAPHLAIDVANRTGRRLVLAGQVYPFRYHQEYFARNVKPHLGGKVEFIDSPPFELKIELLSRASALLIPSLAEETSSLVAMEAMACGTPVVAFRRGALPEIVVHRHTGFIVDKLDSMTYAVDDLHSIRPQNCRAHVERQFSARRMADDYLNLYQRVLPRSVSEAA